MTCCNNKESHADLKTSATKLGFDPVWIANIISQYGDQVLVLVVEAVKGGMSIQVVTDIITQFGPAILQFLVSLMGKKKSVKPAVPLPVPNVDLTIIQIFLEQYLPALLQQYGPQIAQYAINWLIAYLQSLPAPTPVPTPTPPVPTPIPAVVT